MPYHMLMSSYCKISKELMIFASHQSFFKLVFWEVLPFFVNQNTVRTKCICRLNSLFLVILFCWKYGYYFDMKNHDQQK